MTDMHTSDSSSMTQSPNLPQRDGYREQLSAMMDGALSADESRFLLRRMQHDAELAGCWERWQLFGDAMRGQTGTALPADFSRRVARAIADDTRARRAAAQDAEPAPAADAAVAWRQRLRWGGGAALAASVAIAALISTRQPALDDASTATPAVAAHAPSTAAPTAAPATGATARIAETAAIPADSIPRKMASIPSVSSSAIPSSAPLTVASAPERTRRDARPSIRLSGERVRAAETSATAAIATVSDGVATASAASTDPFGRPNRDIAAKPWPRALLPEAAGAMSGAMTVDYSAAGLHPSFQPRTDAADAPSESPAAPSSDAPSP